METFSRVWFRLSFAQRLAVFALSTLFFPFAAFAQEAVLTAAPAPDEITQALTQLLGAAKSGQVGLAVVVGLVLVTRLALRFGSRLPGKAGEWFSSPTATWILPMAISILGALVTTLTIPGATFSVPVLLSAVLIGLASGGHGASAAAVAKAKSDGETEAAKVDSPQAAVDAINGKGPNP